MNYRKIFEELVGLQLEKFQEQKQVRNLHGGGKIGTSVSLAFKSANFRLQLTAIEIQVEISPMSLFFEYIRNNVWMAQ